MSNPDTRVFFTANLAGQIRTWSDTWQGNRIPDLLALATPARKSQAQMIDGFELRKETLRAIAIEAQQRMQEDRDDQMAQLIWSELRGLLG